MHYYTNEIKLKDKYFCSREVVYKSEILSSKSSIFESVYNKPKKCRHLQMEQNDAIGVLNIIPGY